MSEYENATLCLHCQNPVPQTEGKRARLYCDAVCKGNWHNAAERKLTRAEVMAAYMQWVMSSKIEVNSEGKIVFYNPHHTCLSLAKEYILVVARMSRKKKREILEKEEKAAAKLPRMAERFEGEGVIDYGLRKAKWKEMYS